MGVPYLSEQEEVEARERYDQRIERNAAIPSIVFDPSDVGTLEFYRRARSSITEWIEAKEVSNLRFTITIRDHVFPFPVNSLTEDIPFDCSSRTRVLWLLIC